METAATQNFKPSFDWEILENEIDIDAYFAEEEKKKAEEKLQKDALRYRWLRNNCNLMPSVFGFGKVALSMGKQTEIDKQQLDSYLDASWVAQLTETQDAALTKVQQPATPEFTPVAAQKLESLLADGFSITGYSLEKQVGVCSPPIQGLCTANGLAGWFSKTPSGPIGPLPENKPCSSQAQTSPPLDAELIEADEDAHIPASCFKSPDFLPSAFRKLAILLADGFNITGYSVEKKTSSTDTQPKRGFCTAGGLVGWWNPPSGTVEPVADRDEPSSTKICSQRAGKRANRKFNGI